MNLAIAKFCPNLRKLYTKFKKNSSETLKVIFNSCKYLESIKIWSGLYGYLDTRELFEILTKCSPKNFHELKLYPSNLLLKEDLEEFFINWENRVPLSFIAVMDYSYSSEDDYEIIE